MRIHRSTCPACDSAHVHPVLKATDHTVSRETFGVWQCLTCGLRFTQDVPGPEDIGSYYASEEYISHSNTSKGLINGLYQRVRAITLSQKLSLVQEATDLEMGTLLDVGCGTGEFAHKMQSAGWRVKGLEPDAGARAFAKTNYGLDVAPPEELKHLAGPYDAVTLWHVLEHVHDLHGYLDELHRLIGKDGVLVVAVPNYTSADGKRYAGAWAAYDVPRHLYHFSPPAMGELLAFHGIEVTEMRAMPFDAFYVSMLSEKYKGSNQMGLLSAFVSGLKTLSDGTRDAMKSSSVIYVCRRANN